LTSIIKRGRFYWIDYYHDGRRRRQSLKTDELQRARDRARKIEEGLGKGEGGVLLTDFTETYFAWARSTKPASASREKQRWDKIAAFLKVEGVITLPAITPLVVEKFRAHLLEAGTKRKNKKGEFVPCGLSRATVNRYLQLLRGMFYRAADWGLYAGLNPLRKVKFFREEHRISGLDAGQVKAILEAARQISAKPHSRLQALFPDLILLDLNTGLRKSELLNLRWSDIKDHELCIKGKGGRIRQVPLNQAALDILDRQPRTGSYVFDIPNRHQAGLFRRTTAMISKQAELPFHFHLLRHTFATALLARGVDIVTIAEILGHSRATVSLIYTHSSPARARQAVSLLDSQPQ